MRGDVTTGEDPTKAILSKSSLNEKDLCDYVINVATGCSHGCKFCYVPSTPMIRTRGDMLAEEADVEDGQQEWGEYVLYRDHIPDELPGLLDRKQKWRTTENGRGVVGISFGTDCFMDARAGDITRAVVESLAEHERHARVLTRNPLLAAKHLDTFKDAGEYVTIGSSIPTLNESHMAALEPNAPSIEARFEGLQRFADAGVPVYVSMSPTYPTMTRDSLHELLSRISTLDPEVVFHEPINPRGSNFEMTVAAAEAAGEDELANALVDVHGEDAWLQYACRHFSWVQHFGAEFDLPVHLWPDKALVANANGAVAAWLQAWRDRQSPESFAGRDVPEEPPLQPPAFPWEVDA